MTLCHGSIGTDIHTLNLYTHNIYIIYIIYTVFTKVYFIHIYYIHIIRGDNIIYITYIIL